MEKRYRYDDEGKKHCHTLDGKVLIGTSSVASVINKPLSWWAAGLALMKVGWTKIQDDYHKIPAETIQRCAELGLEFKKGTSKGKVLIPKEIRLENAKKGWNKLVGLSVVDYLKLLDEGYYAHDKEKDRTAEAGTDLHAELEKYVKNTMLCYKTSMKDTTEYPVQIKPFIDWVEAEVDHFLWSEIHCYSEKYWVGGISDCGYKRKNGVVGIMDFKSSKEVYKTAFFQDAGYDIEISENGGFDKDGNKIFELEEKITEYAVLAFGKANIVPEFYHDIEKARECFVCETILYKELNR